MAEDKASTNLKRVTCPSCAAPAKQGDSVCKFCGTSFAANHTSQPTVVHNTTVINVTQNNPKNQVSANSSQNQFVQPVFIKPVTKRKRERVLVIGNCIKLGLIIVATIVFVNTHLMFKKPYFNSSSTFDPITHVYMTEKNGTTITKIEYYKNQYIFRSQEGLEKYVILVYTDKQILKYSATQYKIDDIKTNYSTAIMMNKINPKSSLPIWTFVLILLVIITFPFNLIYKRYMKDRNKNIKRDL